MTNFLLPSAENTKNEQFFDILMTITLKVTQLNKIPAAARNSKHNWNGEGCERLLIAV